MPFVLTFHKIRNVRALYLFQSTKPLSLRFRKWNPAVAFDIPVARAISSCVGLYLWFFRWSRIAARMSFSRGVGFLSSFFFISAILSHFWLVCQVYQPGRTVRTPRPYQGGELPDSIQKYLRVTKSRIKVIRAEYLFLSYRPYQITEHRNSPITFSLGFV